MKLREGDIYLKIRSRNEFKKDRHRPEDEIGNKFKRGRHRLEDEIC